MSETWPSKAESSGTTLNKGRERMRRSKTLNSASKLETMRKDWEVSTTRDRGLVAPWGMWAAMRGLLRSSTWMREAERAARQRSALNVRMMEMGSKQSGSGEMRGSPEMSQWCSKSVAWSVAPTCPPEVKRRVSPRRKAVATLTNAVDEWSCEAAEEELISDEEEDNEGAEANEEEGQCCHN